jgi:predicted dehydrogenase
MAEKIRLGLIGASVTGTWSSRSHLPALRASADIELTAVCTTRADSAEAVRQAYGARLAFDDWRKMVASPEIDAVAVVVRVPSHYEPTKAALEAGKHVYCEWPLGRTTAEAEELIVELARQYGRYGYRKIAELLRRAGWLVCAWFRRRHSRRRAAGSPRGETPRKTP